MGWEYIIPSSSLRIKTFGTQNILFNSWMEILSPTKNEKQNISQSYSIISHYVHFERTYILKQKPLLIVISDYDSGKGYQYFLVNGGKS